MALWAGTPRGWRNSTKAPSRMPRPEMPMGSTWAMSTAGRNTSSAVKPTSLPMPMA